MWIINLTDAQCCRALTVIHFTGGCANGVILYFWVFCQLSMKDEEREKEIMGQRGRSATERKEEDKAGGYIKRGRKVMRYGMMKGRRITYRWNQESFGRSCLIINRTYFLFFVLSPILLNSSHHSFGRLASIINMQLSFRWWTDIRPFHRWMQPQRKDFPPDLCPGGMLSHNTHFTEFPTFWE